MRKFYLIFLTVLLSWQLKAQFPEGFEGSFPPTGWTTFIGTNGLGTAQDWTTSTSANSGTSAAFVRFENVTGGEAEDWLVTPQFTPSATANILEFFQRQAFGSDFGSVYTIRVSTSSQTNHADFTIVDTQTEADFGTTYSPKVIDLSAYNGQAIYVAFVMSNDDGDSWYVDDVNLIAAATPPNCAENPTPANGATNVALNTDGSVTISWNAPSSGDAPSEYEIFWGETSGSLTSLGTVTDTTADITGIDFSTTYYWQIVPSNSGGSATGCVEWNLTTENAPPPPANDLPTGAIELTLDEGTSCGANTITGISNESATDSGVANPSCGNYNGGDLWYTFTAPSTSVTLNTTNVVGLTSVASSYYTGTPGSLAEQGCTQFSSGWPWELTGLTVGETYYLRVWDFGGDQTGSFDLCGYYLGCEPGVATTEITTTCSTGGTEFSVMVNFSTLGDATAVTDGTNTYTISGSTATAGPYPLGAPVTLTVVHSNANCDFELGTYQVDTCPPVNDECDNAISLPVNAPGDDCVATTSSTNANATASPQTDDVSGTPDNDVWYSFVATEDGAEISLSNVVAVTGTSTDMGMGLYSGSCASLTLVATSDPNTFTASGLTVGDTYYLRVYGWGSGTFSAQTTYDICVNAVDVPDPPANDDCANATMVSSLPFTSAADATSATNNSGFIADCSGGMNDGVWYTYTPSQNEFVDINLTGVTGWDPEIAIYSGSCGSFTCVASADNSGSGSGESLTGVELMAGTQYFINLGHWSNFTDGSEGPYSLEIDLNPTLNTIDSNINNTGFDVYPNPVSNVLNIKTSINVKQVQLFSMQGKRMNAIVIGANNKEIAVSQLASGMYLVQVELEDGSIEVRKFIKK